MLNMILNSVFTVIALGILAFFCLSVGSTLKRYFGGNIVLWIATVLIGLIVMSGLLTFTTWAKVILFGTMFLFSLVALYKNEKY